MKKRRTSVLIDERLLADARRLLDAETNTAAITGALEEAVANRRIEKALLDLIRQGRGRFVDVGKGS